MTPCAKCKCETNREGALALCAECFSKWPQRYTLEEFIQAKKLPDNPRTKKIPYLKSGLPPFQP